MSLKSYDLSAVVCTLGPILVGGYGEEGGLEYEWAAPIGEFNVGATGLTTFSRNNNGLLFVNITVMESSLAYNLLGAAMKAQELTPFVIVPIPFFMKDFINGDQIATATSVFEARPTPSKGRTVGERVFRLGLPKAAGSALYGIQNLVP